VYCLGLCASSPAVQIDDKLYARMDKTRLARLVADIGSTS
jgi:formate dehydrogenase subunit gamma